MSHWKKQAGFAALSGAILGVAVMGVDMFQDGRFALAAEHVDATRQQLASIQDSSAVYREIHSVVEPSVVEIQVHKTVKTQTQQVPEEFQKFFHQFGDQFGQNGFPDSPQQGGALRETGTGSGVIMDVSDGYGYILTNNHVAGDGASDITVLLNDGRVIKDAQLVGADPRTDLAVVKIKADHLIPAKWGDSRELDTGDTILAFGAPFGYVGSMTHGIVSALHRQAGILGTDGYENFIQVDAPINPGNSGGPLVNLHGEVVGINTAIASSNGGFEGIGFAIPSEEARPIYDQLKQSGKVTRGYLGVEIQNVASVSQDAASEGYEGESGVLVREVRQNGPAAGELKAGDIVTKVNGQTVTNAQELQADIAVAAPGSDVTLNVFRDGKYEDVKVKIGSMPADLGSETPTAEANANGAGPQIGVRMQTLNDELANQYGVADKSGAVVTAVQPGSLAADAGLRVGDVITRINHHEVHDANEAQEALKKADAQHGIRLQVDNRQGSEFLFVKADQ